MEVNELMNLIVNNGFAVAVSAYLLIRLEKQINGLSASINKLNTIISTKLGVVIDNDDSNKVAFGFPSDKTFFSPFPLSFCEVSWFLWLESCKFIFICFVTLSNASSAIFLYLHIIFGISLYSPIF